MRMEPKHENLTLYTQSVSSHEARVEAFKIPLSSASSNKAFLPSTFNLGLFKQREKTERRSSQPQLRSHEGGGRTSLLAPKLLSVIGVMEEVAMGGGGEGVVAGGDEERPNSPPPKCAICLGDVTNKAYSNACIHQFCFSCLLEWSKVKAECPLCKAQFRSIYHNIRSNADYDEFVVPTPQPPTLSTFSIRLSGRDGLPDVFIDRRDRSSGFPWFPSNRGMSTRSGARAAAQYLPPPILDSSPNLVVQFGPYSRSANIDVNVHGHPGSVNAFHENPFHVEVPEFFGGLLDMSRRSPSRNSNFSGYQTRRRRYNRNQWVRPFNSNLRAGSSVFPSVEFFQRHPSDIRRISPWLHRELTVLMSPGSSRSQMAFTYDLILSLLLRYDIRSQEFRELLRPYLAANTRQFQHEFYHFVLSGMRIEEYDRVAQYATPPTQTVTSLGDSRNPFEIVPQVVTLESEEEDDIVIEREVTGRGSGSGSQHSPAPSSSHQFLTETFSPGLAPTRERSRSRNSSSSRRSSPLNYSQLAELTEASNTIDCEVARLRGAHSSSSSSPLSFNIEGSRSNSSHSNLSAGHSRTFSGMPVLEPQVDVNLNNLSAAGSAGTSAFRRVRGEERIPGLNSSSFYDHSNNEDPASSFADALLLSPPSGRRRGRGSTYMDPEDGRRPPYPLIEADADPIMSWLETHQRRDTDRVDFPILELRERRRNERRDIGDRDRTTIPLPQTSSSSVEIRIFPQAVDLTIPSHDSRRSRARGRTPEHGVRTGAEEGDCEFLGVHPVVKKPPLAVITLSSEDEEDEEDQDSRQSPRPSTSKETLKLLKKLKPTQTELLPSTSSASATAPNDDVPAPVDYPILKRRRLQQLSDQEEEEELQESPYLVPTSRQRKRKSSSISKRKTVKKSRSSSKAKKSSKEKRALSPPSKKQKVAKRGKKDLSSFGLLSDSVSSSSSGSGSEESSSEDELFSPSLPPSPPPPKREKGKRSKKVKKSKKSKSFSPKEKTKGKKIPQLNEKKMPKLKSVVTKVSGPGKGKIPISKEWLSSSSSSDDDSPPKLKSVIGSISIKGVKGEQRSEIPTHTPSTSTSAHSSSALDLSSSFSPCPSHHRHRPRISNTRRWESEDDEEDGPSAVKYEEDMYESGSLLSLNSGNDSLSSEDYEDFLRLKNRKRIKELLCSSSNDEDSD